MFTDLIIAVSVFMIIITLAFMSFESNKLNLESTDAIYMMQNKATVLSDILVKQRIVMTINNTEYGIVSEPNLLSIENLNNFSNINYSIMKDKLALGYYEFYVNISYTNNIQIKEFGNNTSGNYTSYSTKRILAAPGNKTAVMEMILWQKV